MQIIDLLSPERVQTDAPARSKKRLLELLSEVLASDESGLKARHVFNSLCARERLGTTALGNGVAIPHGRMPEAQVPVGAFIRLRDPIDFEAPDQGPVDLIFGMVVPEELQEQHLQLLAQLAELFNDAERRDDLREVTGGNDIMNLLESWQSQRAAG